MKRIFDYILSIIYVAWFGLFLIIFHPIQMFCLHFFGSKVHQKSVQILNFFLLHGIYLTGTRFSYQNNSKVDPSRPLLIVANHQSMFDIIGIIWLLRQYNPIFVSKQELAKGIPSISYNLRYSGAALIDRKDSRQAVPEISRMAKWAVNQHFAATIFPEGTRSKTDEIKKFAVGGLAILLKNMPNAQILPLVIQGNNKLNPKGFFPLVCFSTISFKTLKVIETDGRKAEEITNIVESLIKNEVISLAKKN